MFECPSKFGQKKYTYQIHDWYVNPPNIITYKLVSPNSVIFVKSNIYRGHEKARLSGWLEEAKDLTKKQQ